MSFARILWIGNDTAERSTLAGNLQELGYAVASALDGPSSLAALARAGTELVLLDLALRGMDPLALCRRIKEQAGDSFLPVVFLTRAPDVGKWVQALEAGADDIWLETMRLDELDARLRVFLRRRESEKRLVTQSDRFRLYAYVDALTSLGNRRALERELGYAWARTVRSRRPLALLMIDIDHFKSFNDHHGHPSGDAILRTVAQTIEAAIRKGDQPFRMGGEEFVVLAPDTPQPGALVLAERIRRAVGHSALISPNGNGDGPLSVTVSVGVAVAPDPGIACEAALVEAADRALYDAKAAGRNRIVASARHAALGQS